MFDRAGKYVNKIKNKKVRKSVSFVQLPGGLNYPAVHADHYEKLEQQNAEMLAMLKELRDFHYSGGRYPRLDELIKKVEGENGK